LIRSGIYCDLAHSRTSYFLKTALGEAGYVSISDLDGVDANDLRIGQLPKKYPIPKAQICTELSIALAHAEDIIRLVEGLRGMFNSQDHSFDILR
jgi:hypothetical protein